MKKTLILYLVLTLLGCSNSNEPTTPNNTAFEGLWSGSFSGEDNGTWTFSVDNNGDVTGSLTSKAFNEIYFLNGTVDDTGLLEATVTKDAVVGTFTMQLDSAQSTGEFENTVAQRTSSTEGKECTENEAKIINYWNYYSGEWPDGSILYFDDDSYCPGLYMEFRADGTFTDYFASPTLQNCSDPAWFGTYSVQDGYYEMLYEQGGAGDLSQDDIYINYPDDNTITYVYNSITWTYKIDVTQ